MVFAYQTEKSGLKNAEVNNNPTENNISFYESELQLVISQMTDGFGECEDGIKKFFIQNNTTVNSQNINHTRNFVRFKLILVTSHKICNFYTDLPPPLTA